MASERLPKVSAYSGKDGCGSSQSLPVHTSSRQPRWALSDFGTTNVQGLIVIRGHGLWTRTLGCKAGPPHYHGIGTCISISRVY